MLAVLVRNGARASEITRVFDPLPQVLKNVPVNGAAPLDNERALGAQGRLLVRKSGTEPLVRVMGEGEDEKAVGEVVDSIARTIADVAG